jgi:hypothetical protein
VTAQAAMLYALVADGPTDRSRARAQAVRELIETTATSRAWQLCRAWDD